MSIHLLRDRDIQAFGPRLKKDSDSEFAGEYTVSDGGGLYLIVRLADDGHVDKYWSYIYTLGRRRKMGLGKYPAVSLANARRLATALREKVALGIDPIAEKEQLDKERVLELARKVNTFETVSNDWFEWSREQEQWQNDTAQSKRGQLDNHILPWIGKKPIHIINEREVAKVVRRVVEGGSPSVAPRVRKIIKNVFQHAVDNGQLESKDNFMLNASTIGGKLVESTDNFPAITNAQVFRELLLDIDAYKGRGPVVPLCMRLLPLLAQRPGQVVSMRWADVHLNTGEWHVKVADRKGKNKKQRKKRPAFIVPLPHQAVSILRDLQRFTGDQMYVFAGQRRDRHITRETLNRALQSMGWKTSGDDEHTHCAHGFRTSFLTLTQEAFGSGVATAADRHLIHEPKIDDAASNLGAVYNRAMLTDERRILVQRWADYLDQLKTGDAPGTNVIDINKKVA